MKTPSPTKSEMDKLISFLPRLYAEGFESVKKLREPTVRENGALDLDPPEYDNQVIEFFQAASEDGWCDPGYLSTAAGGMLKTPDSIKAASLNEVRSMLTHCVRAERFCDGSWESVINGGQVRLILMRLQELQELQAALIR